MGCFEIRVTINRAVATVFEVYTDTEKWCRYTDISSVRWVRGNPWVVESRMRIETARGVGPAVDQVLTHFEPNSRVEYISHFLGITMQSRVSFHAVSERQTEIYGQMEFVGTGSRIVAFAIGPAIEHSTRQFFADLKQDCERDQAVADSVSAAVRVGIRQDKQFPS